MHGTLTDSLAYYLEHRPQEQVLIFLKSIRINQLPISATGWQHGSQICLATFNLWKVQKCFLTQQPPKQEKK